jgi:putative ABC transport system permease protein
MLRVRGIWLSPENLGYSISIGPNALLTEWGPQPPHWTWVQPASGVTPATMAQEISAAHVQRGLIVLTPNQYIARFSRDVTSFVEPFWVLQRLLLLVALIAAVSTLLLVGYERRREHAMLSAVGMAPAGLLRTTLLEGLGVAVAGAVLGLIASVGLGMAFFFTTGILFGLKPPIGFNFGPGLVYAALGIVVVVAGAVWPAWRTSRLDVVDALRYE